MISAIGLIGFKKTFPFYNSVVEYNIEIYEIATRNYK